MKEVSPLGTQFKSYELTSASNYWTLDPCQYNITKIEYKLPNGVSTSKKDNKLLDKPGSLIYKDVNFDKLLPVYTSEKRSVNDFTAQSYPRFEANDGYFNPANSKDLWYYGASEISKSNGLNLSGKALNVQDDKHIIFPEPQRGGLNTQAMAKYSWSQTYDKKKLGDNLSWESYNSKYIDNGNNCNNFKYNNKNRGDNFNQVYSFDSDYCRNIGISGPKEGTMPYL